MDPRNYENIDINPMVLLEECVRNLKNHTRIGSLLSAIQTLERYPVEDDYIDPMTFERKTARWMMIDHLVTNCDILAHLFTDMNLRQEANKKSADVSHHFTFLNYITNNHKIEFNPQQMAQIYRAFPLNQTDRTAFDHELVFELLVNIFGGAINNLDLENCIEKRSQMAKKLYTHFVTPYLKDTHNVRLLNALGFRLLSLCLLVCNHVNNALVVQNITKKEDYYGPKNEDYDVFFVQYPKKLIGLEILKNISENCEVKLVSEKARKLHDQLLAPAQNSAFYYEDEGKCIMIIAVVVVLLTILLAFI